MESFLVENRDLFMLHSEYHAYWCSNDALSQGLRSQYIGLVQPEYSGLSNRRLYLIDSLVSDKCGYRWQIFFKIHFVAFIKSGVLTDMLISLLFGASISICSCQEPGLRCVYMIIIRTLCRSRCPFQYHIRHFIIRYRKVSRRKFGV